MAISENQIKIVQEYRSRLKKQLREYEAAPEDVKQPFDELWTVFKETAEFSDDNQADLAAFGALSQFILLAENMDEKHLKELLMLYSMSILVKIRKGDRLD